ncbi:hypothetical protein J0A68_09240 [Algoriphagus sp. H41]|uniref:Methylmalonyl-CoA mutase alpha/beta chain catalytic domain-containing protein n=1 Tax=Algoriphagus oliviformis TaxID=2811231 RepID=A0ABS3C2M3_9BACT|nr:methylmalonyl-CoA mutase family protein [Algoriphagus oliviformis]MBN7811140.1 hypothetical protein [Algoriphagus oliviformis]
MTKDLFSEFEPSSKDAWISQAIRDLKGKDFDQSLGTTLWERIVLQPFYTLEDLGGQIPRQASFQSESDDRQDAPRQWANLVSVYPDESSETFLHQLENGAEGLVLHLSGFEDLEQLLQGVKPEYIPILIQPTANPLVALGSFLAWVEGKGLDPAQISGALLWAPSDMVFGENADYGLAVEVFREILELTEAFPHFKAFSLKSSRYTEAGGNPLDAVIFAMGELIDLIDASGESPRRVVGAMLLEVSVGEAYFGEIARLKAFRRAVTALGRLYFEEVEGSELQLLAQTSGWSKSILDSNTNLIRQSYEAMAALLGGANLLWTRPLLEEQAGELEKRMAKNVSSLLREEAFLDKVQDPASGSFFLEKLSEYILGDIQAGLKSLEEKGGWLTALKEGIVHAQIRTHRAKIQNQVAEKLIPKIGANKYPASASLKSDLEFEFFGEKSFELNPSRASYLVELKNQELL